MSYRIGYVLRQSAILFDEVFSFMNAPTKVYFYLRFLINGNQQKFAGGYMNVDDIFGIRFELKTVERPNVRTFSNVQKSNTYVCLLQEDITYLSLKG